MNELAPHAQGSSLVQGKHVLVRYVLTVVGIPEESDGRQDSIPAVTMKITLAVHDVKKTVILDTDYLSIRLALGDDLEASFLYRAREDTDTNSATVE